MTEMAEQRTERRLAAILAGDVAGYSKLMAADEEDTLTRLNAHRREFLDPKIAEHRGRVVKRMGDGVLIEFASAVDATRCAVEIQRGMTGRNAEVLANSDSDPLQKWSVHRSAPFATSQLPHFRGEAL
jgi:adenylate cyclase